MLLRLFLLFTIIPVVELWLLITIGRTICAWPTIALVLLTGAAGAALARHEGTRVLSGWRRAITEGRLPEEGILEGALVLVGGVLLLTPGVVTDAMGILLLVRPTRRIAAVWVRRKLEKSIADGTIRVQGFGFTPPGASRGDATGRVVGSEEVPDTPKKTGGPDSGPSKLLH